MSFLARAGSMILQHAPKLITAGLNAFGFKNATHALHSAGNAVLGRLGLGGLGKVDAFAPGVKAFRSQLNKVGAFIDQKKPDEPMMVDPKGNQGTQYEESQQEQRRKMTTPAAEYVSKKQMRRSATQAKYEAKHAKEGTVNPEKVDPPTNYDQADVSNVAEQGANQGSILASNMLL